MRSQDEFVEAQNSYYFWRGKDGDTDELPSPNIHDWYSYHRWALGDRISPGGIVEVSPGELAATSHGKSPIPGSRDRVEDGFGFKSSSNSVPYTDLSRSEREWLEGKKRGKRVELKLYAFKDSASYQSRWIEPVWEK